MNPCPCSYFGDPEHECTCSSGLISRYQKRLSGPLLDRIDITYGVVSRHVEAPRVPFQKLSESAAGSRRRRSGHVSRRRGCGSRRGSPT
ncbi:MAG: ATP-binding protein [Chloroflexi bacterium]|nr:ATP-binding protein [Chloroflexota bacterium]